MAPIASYVTFGIFGFNKSGGANKYFNVSKYLEHLCQFLYLISSLHYGMLIQDHYQEDYILKYWLILQVMDNILEHKLQQ